MTNEKTVCKNLDFFEFISFSRDMNIFILKFIRRKKKVYFLIIKIRSNIDFVRKFLIKLYKIHFYIDLITNYFTKIYRKCLPCSLYNLNILNSSKFKIFLVK